MKIEQQSILEKDIVKLLTPQEKEVFTTIAKKLDINFKKCSNLLYSKLSEDRKYRFCIWLLKRWFKIDIEGAEKQALIGSTMVIRKYKPKLAICLYHKPDDIFEIPETILNIDSSYKFDFKWVELNGGHEAVLFAQ